MSEIIVKVCSLPRDLRYHGNKSINQLFHESGYLEQPQEVTKEKLIDHLIANPGLIKDWEIYSSDKRYDPAWYFLKNGSEWIVGYSSVPSQEHKQIFNSAAEACSEFILHELKAWTENATRK